VESQELVQDPLLRKSLDYIRRNYSTNFGVTDIAKALGCCDRSLRLHFRNTLGVRPLEYLQRYRLARAKELIEYSDYSLKEIAVRVGFKNVQHFTRLFAATEGQSPGAWRQRYREGIRKDVCINPRFENPNWTRT
jgi:transcriptional regulator GlxA family with amidase domain